MRKKFLIRKIRSAFECQRCSLCCRVPGYVFLKGKDIRQMADYLKMAPEQFLTEYTEKHEGHTVLKNFPDGACIFLTESGCRVHPAKPVQCREFPARWREADAYDYCEGILRLRNQPANA